MTLIFMDVAAFKGGARSFGGMVGQEEGSDGHGTLDIQQAVAALGVGVP